MCGNAILERLTKHMASSNSNCVALGQPKWFTICSWVQYQVYLRIGVWLLLFSDGFLPFDRDTKLTLLTDLCDFRGNLCFEKWMSYATASVHQLCYCLPKCEEMVFNPYVQSLPLKPHELCRNGLFPNINLHNSLC